MLRLLLVLLLWMSACASLPEREATEQEAAQYFAAGRPAPKQRFAPNYPMQAAVDGTTGTVLLEYTIGGDGRPTGIEVLESTPAGVFDEASKRSVARWVYHPITSDGHALRLPGKRFRYVYELAPCSDPVAVARKYEEETVLVCGEVRTWP